MKTEENAEETTKVSEPKFVRINARITPAHYRKLKLIAKINRLDSVCQALRFVLSEKKL